MAGRVMGWLLVCDPPRQAFDELVEALAASKGSISGTTRLLVQLGILQRTTEPGDRRTFFQIHPDAWTRFLAERVQTVAASRRLAERGMELLAGETPARRERVRSMHELYAFWEEEAHATFRRWEERQSKASP